MLRRLHTEQPDSFAFTPENQKWAEAQIGKYPEGRQASAVIPLLWRAQEQEGWVSKPIIETVAQMLDLEYPRVRSRVLLLHVPAQARRRSCAFPDLRHDVLHDLRRGRPDRRL